MRQIFHYVKNISENNIVGDPYNWVVMWQDTIICCTYSNEIALRIAWALDTAKPYFEK
jgi:hypothetical protein